MSTEKISEKIRYEHCTYNMQSWSKQKGLNPIPIEKADGIYMWDFDGNRYTDMSSQLVNLNVGHGNRDGHFALGLGGQRNRHGHEITAAFLDDR